ncbi:MAG: hydroxyacid dehydrogenase [Flavobacteriaceae bacterium]|nr:hydroxyacid dehydrogenase [Flavobacteriaceae bacterium]|tara:strand:- start:1648 stop:2571 length:924 start_codon:yes stop_codon:yes gene_type:complete
MNKILTSPSSFGQIDNKPFEILKNHGFEIINNPFGRKLTEDEVIELAEGCVGIVAGVEPLTSKVIDCLPVLKCISRVGVGMDSVDLVYAEKNNIKVVNTPNGPTRAVAELTLGLALSLLRKIPHAHFDLKNKVWKKQTGNLLFGKKIGILGLGRIGRMTAEMFRALGNSVIGYDLYPDLEWAEKNNVEILGLEQLLNECDIITIHIPGNSDGSCVLNQEELSYIKDGAFLVNVSRGGVINEDALYEILTNGKLSAAALDVFSNEPYSGKFCDLDNVILTPHIGSYAKEGKLKMEVDAVMNLINALKL